MIRYVAADISFQEVPDRIALVFYISGCSNHCPGCHSPILQQDVGLPLTADVLREYCARYEGMFDCVCFMGDGGDFPSIARLVLEAKLLDKHAALYTGAEDVPLYLWGLLSYLKLGPYKEELGGLASPDTNQVFWRIDHFGRRYNDTHKFRHDTFAPRCF